MELTPAKINATAVSPVAVNPVKINPATLTPATVTPVTVNPETITPKAVTPVKITPAAVNPAKVTPVKITPKSVTPKISNAKPGMSTTTKIMIGGGVTVSVFIIGIVIYFVFIKKKKPPPPAPAKVVTAAAPLAGPLVSVPTDYPRNEPLPVEVFQNSAIATSISGAASTESTNKIVVAQKEQEKMAPLIDKAEQTLRSDPVFLATPIGQELLSDIQAIRAQSEKVGAAILIAVAATLFANFALLQQNGYTQAVNYTQIVYVQANPEKETGDYYVYKKIYIDSADSTISRINHINSIMDNYKINPKLFSNIVDELNNIITIYESMVAENKRMIVDKTPLPWGRIHQTDIYANASVVPALYLAATKIYKTSMPGIYNEYNAHINNLKSEIKNLSGLLNALDTNYNNVKNVPTNIETILLLMRSDNKTINTLASGILGRPAQDLTSAGINTDDIDQIKKSSASYVGAGETIKSKVMTDIQTYTADHQKQSPTAILNSAKSVIDKYNNYIREDKGRKEINSFVDNLNKVTIKTLNTYVSGKKEPNLLSYFSDPKIHGANLPDIVPDLPSNDPFYTPYTLDSFKSPGGVNDTLKKYGIVYKGRVKIDLI